MYFKEKKNVSHGNRGRTQMPLSGQLSNHWLPLFLYFPRFTDNVTRETVECLPQWPNMALPYSAPYGSRPIKKQYQHQQDTAGHRETMAWF